MRTGLFCVTGYQNLCFAVPCALLKFPGAELGRGGWTGRKGNMKNHLADGVAVQGEVQKSPAVPCSPRSTSLYPSTASAPCVKCKNPVPAHGAFGARNVCLGQRKGSVGSSGLPPARGFGLQSHWDIRGACLLHRETEGEMCSCQTTAHSHSGILTAPWRPVLML